MPESSSSWRSRWIVGIVLATYVICQLYYYNVDMTIFNNKTCNSSSRCTRNENNRNVDGNDDWRNINSSLSSSINSNLHNNYSDSNIQPVIQRSTTTQARQAEREQPKQSYRVEEDDIIVNSPVITMNSTVSNDNNDQNSTIGSFGTKTIDIDRPNTTHSPSPRQQQQQQQQQQHSKSQPSNSPSESSSTLSPIRKHEEKQQQKQLDDDRRPSVVSIVVNLSGELGNNLHHIAHGIGLQRWLFEDFNVTANIVIRHFGDNNNNRSGKWKKAYHDIQQCFPKLRSWDFTLGNSQQFEQINNIQKQWLGNRHDQIIGLVNSADLSDVRTGLYRLARNVLRDSSKPDTTSISTSIHVPFIVSLTILDVFPVIDRHFDTIKDMFEFDVTNPTCCALLPTADERVFHFRNYMSELPDWKAYSMGFTEISPNKTAYELYGPSEQRSMISSQASSTTTTSTTTSAEAKSSISSSSSTSTMTSSFSPSLSPGEKVTITSRIPNKYARAYAEALNDVWSTNATLLRYDQTGVQDFCYLYHTQRELVGNGRSTFLFWAAVLGHAQTVRLYHIDNYGLRQKFPNYWKRFTYNWTNPDLQRRVHWELYQSEEVDKKEGPLLDGPIRIN